MSEIKKQHEQDELEPRELSLEEIFLRFYIADEVVSRKS